MSLYFGRTFALSQFSKVPGLTILKRFSTGDATSKSVIAKKESKDETVSEKTEKTQFITADVVSGAPSKEFKMNSIKSVKDLINCNI